MDAQILKKELIDFIAKLHELGKEDLLCLISLTQVVQPELEFPWRVPLLSQIFREVPNFIDQLIKQGLDLSAMVASPPSDLPHFRLLIDMIKILPILHNLSYSALLIITNCMPEGSSAAIQHQMLLKLQAVLQGWTNVNIREYVEVIFKTPMHLERERILELDARVPLDIVPMIIKILRLDVGEIERLKLWLQNLKEIDLIIMANMFQFESSVLTKLKRHFAPPAHNNPKVNKNQPPSGVAHLPNMEHVSQNNPPSTPKSLKRQRTEDVIDLEHPMKTLNVSPPVAPTITSRSTDTSNTSSSANNNSRNNLEAELFGEDNSNGEDCVIVSKVNPTRTISPLKKTKSSVVVTPSPPVSPSPTAAASSVIRIHSISQYKPPTPPVVTVPTTPPLASSGSASVVDNVASEKSFSSQQSQWVLKVLDKGPPSQTVYQRILKPYPAVILLPPVQDSSQDLGLFVEASLIRSDTNTELPSTLEGTKIIRIEPGKMASFKKLKILSTTQQIGALVRIKFQLKKANEGSFITIHGVHTVSNPIEVFSHTYYLKDRASLPTPPVVSEILPARGPATGNTRVAILGDNFIDSPNLRIRFGNTILQPIFHESRTLICTTPYGIPQSIVLVSVSNDGVDYSAAQAHFTYD